MNESFVKRETSLVKREASESGTRDVSRFTFHASRVSRTTLAACLSILLLASGLFACGGPGGSSDLAGVAAESTSSSVHLTAAEVQTLIAQAATQAQALGFPVTIAVVDHEGTVLGVLQMAGATTSTTIAGGGTGGLEGLNQGSSGGLVSAANAAISKAGTAAFFSTQGNAFSTRSASFIVQAHFPPNVNPSPGGPLFGVQFSQLRCSDVNRTSHPASTHNLPLGLSADPGGLPIYKNGTAVGGIGVEGDGLYTFDPDSSDDDRSSEEVIAAAGTLGFSAPGGIRGNQILVDGMRIPFANAEPPGSQTTTAYATFAAAGVEVTVPQASPATGFSVATMGGVLGTMDANFPIIAGTDGGLTIPDVTQLLGQAARQAEGTRAAIRVPLGSRARVSITVVDTNGVILGIFRTTDAPVFGFDVSAQKARTANFFTHASAAGDLTAAGFTAYVAAMANDGLALNGSVALTDRAVGFLSQPMYPPGASQPFSHGPLSKPLGQWSVFNTGLQLDLVAGQLGAVGSCTTVAKLPNGMQLFPGSVPLFKNGIHVGAIGVSGDGVDQDDLVSGAGSAGFEAPVGLRSDRVVVRGTPLPFEVFPRHPNL